MFSFNKGVLELSHVDSRARASRSHLALIWTQARWIVSGSSQLGERVLQEDFGLFRSCVKIDSIDMLKFTYTHKLICLVFSLISFEFRIHIYMVFMIR